MTSHRAPPNVAAARYPCKRHLVLKQTLFCDQRQWAPNFIPVCGPMLLRWLSFWKSFDLIDRVKKKLGFPFEKKQSLKSVSLWGWPGQLPCFSCGLLFAQFRSLVDQIELLRNCHLPRTNRLDLPALWNETPAICVPIQETRSCEFASWCLNTRGKTEMCRNKRIYIILSTQPVLQWKCVQNSALNCTKWLW